MYLRTFTLTLMFVLGAIATSNWFIDPYGMFWSPLVQGVNADKTEANKRVRTTKPYRVSKVNPQVLLIGNSRIEMGIAAESELFNEANVYNLGMPGISFERQVGEALKQMSENPNLQSIYFSLDYLDFLYPPSHFLTDNNSVSLEWKDLLGACSLQQELKDNASFLFSLQTFFSSVSTVVKQGRETSIITKQGTHVADSYIGIFANEGKKPLFEQKLNEVAYRLDNTGQVLKLDTIDNNPGIRLLTEFVKKIRNSKIKVTFFTSPYHYTYLHLLNEHKNWDSFLIWKRALAERISTYSGSNIQFWDFSGFNTYTLEAVDLANPHALMEWYWEPAHYRSQLGEVMLAKMVNNSEDNFARIITPQSIEGIIQTDIEKLSSSRGNWLAFRKQLNVK